MKQCFVPRDFNLKQRARVRRADALLEEYAAMGLTFTVRQLYYAFVSENIIENTFREYKNFCELIKDARLAGYLDWDLIEDRTRELESYLMHSSPRAAMDYAIAKYIEDAWEEQDNYVEVWIEKSALIGVLYQPCWKYRLPFMACRGYTSVSEIYVAAQRLQAQMEKGKTAIILHMGDMDPSGDDMTRDNFERLDLLSENCGIEVRRIALNPDQIKKYNPPSQWAKKSDKRHAGYVAKYGTDKSWELDSLKPDVLMEIVSDAVKPLIDWRTWEEHMHREKVSKSYMAETWRLGNKWQVARHTTPGRYNG